jgi:hypothetical protein
MTNAEGVLQLAVGRTYDFRHETEGSFRGTVDFANDRFAIIIIRSIHPYLPMGEPFNSLIALLSWGKPLSDDRRRITHDAKS